MLWSVEASLRVIVTEGTSPVYSEGSWGRGLRVFAPRFHPGGSGWWKSEVKSSLGPIRVGLVHTSFALNPKLNSRGFLMSLRRSASVRSGPRQGVHTLLSGDPRRQGSRIGLALIPQCPRDSSLDTSHTKRQQTPSATVGLRTCPLLTLGPCATGT